ncbi:ornithine carbamoyltransferase [Catenisphaera adipataccumulans]|jgi:ornithine carbamoyltransferase|uniref:Ornithine carbamoyltransferase n=1 Tax=Catenisphaera adipataccumulans TaxID=700500 RepID=A0A7W8CWP8_9FIRM|nr:ornithine carbamoyltransferase [Catenisphaera adipataccumulans]MBB5183000.1 ornithine carbamoyltransferase [Catenisphaera adipataccumulans]
MKHFLTLLETPADEIIEMLDLADQLKQETKQGIFRPYLKNKTIGLIFRKSSTRTRVSFEVGAVQLGAYPLHLDAATMQIGRGEPVQDTARVLSRYLDGIMIRTYEQEEVEGLAKFGSIPVINGLTDFAHPCQVMADLQTIRERKGKLAGLKMAFIGDGNNMCNSLMVGALKTGMAFSCACPQGYKPDPKVLQFAEAYDCFECVDDPMTAVKDADVILTDVWASMGEEGEAEKRRQVFEGTYQVNAALMAEAHPDAMVLHCLPAHRGEEITEEVFEAHADEIFEEAENRLHAQKAIMLTLMGD